MAEQHSEQTIGDVSKKTHRYFRRLRDDAPIEYCVEACQPAHSRYSACRRCADACPVDAIQLVANGVDVSSACVGCGQCAVACPTDALGVPGFAMPTLPDAQAHAAPVFLDCWQVPAGHSPNGAIRIPCLGGLSLSRLVELRVAAGKRPIILLDRGRCGSCPAGGKVCHPASDCVDAVHELLAAMQVPASQWPVIEARPLPAIAAPSTRPDRRSEQKLSRRAFFSDLAARATHTASEINPLTSGKQPPTARGFERDPARSRERNRLLRAVRALSETTGSAVPASLYPAIEIDSHRCSHHQLCAATCPTGALSAFSTSGVTGVVFDASGCIACGHCESICPEHALRLLPQGDGHVPSGAKVLVRIRQSECGGCGRLFEAKAGEQQCPICSKRARLAQSAFQSLFGRPNGV